MATHEIPVDGTDHDHTPGCACRPGRRDRPGGGVVYVHTDRRPDDDAGRDAFCGHVLIDVGTEIQHHEIPDDGAPHAPTTECGCRPQREDAAGHVVYVHPDQNTLAGDTDDDEWGAGQ